MKKKLVKKLKPFITAHIYRGFSYKVAKVPVIVVGKMPDVPGVIRIGREYFVCVSTTPLRYDKSVCLAAEEL